MKNLILIIATFLSLGATAQTSEEIEMVTMVNQIRTNPKSFIPAVETYIKNLELHKRTIGVDNKAFGMKVINSTSTANTSGLNDRLISEAKKLIVVLNNTKPLCVLTVRMDMYIITKDFAKYLDSTQTLDHYKTQERFKSLGIFVSENLNKQNADVLNCLLSLMIDSDGINKSYGHRKNILDPKIKFISVAKFNDIWIQNFSQN